MVGDATRMGVDALVWTPGRFTVLSEGDERLLMGAASDVRAFERRRDIIEEGERPDDVHLVIEGWAARYKLLPNGDQPIMAFLIPGDICGLHVTLLDQMDHSIEAISPCQVAFIPRDVISNILGRSERLTRALWWSPPLDEPILREWLVTVGHRRVDRRLAHLFCEMPLRSKAVGLTDDDSFELPLTQDEFGDTTGLFTVHTHRMMNDLRGQGLFTHRSGRLIVHDLDGLMAFAEFDPNYLHQASKRARLAQVGST